MREKTTILIAERECLFRRGLRVCLEIDQRYQIIGSVGTAREAIAAATQTPHHVALVGLSLPDFSGLALLRELQHRCPSMRGILIVERATHELLLSAMQAGAAAVLEKDATESDLLHLIRRVTAGDPTIDLQIQAHMSTYAVPAISFCPRDSQGDGSCLPISRRELEILRGISCGLTNAEIGALANISVQTVKCHVTSILRKLAVHDRTQAVVLAIQRGWLDVTEVQFDHRPPPITDWHTVSNSRR